MWFEQRPWLCTFWHLSRIMRQQKKNKSKQLLLYSAMILLSSVSLTKIDGAHAFWERPSFCWMFDPAFLSMPRWQQESIARSLVRACIYKSPKIAYYFSQYLDKSSLSDLFFQMDEFQIRVRQVFGGFDLKLLDLYIDGSTYEKKLILKEVKQNKIFVAKNHVYFKNFELPVRCSSFEDNNGCADMIASKTGSSVSRVLRARVAKWNELSDTKGD